jgi:hypothetical protein
MSDIVNLIEWNEWANERKTLLEALTIINNRHREKVSGMESDLKNANLRIERLLERVDELLKKLEVEEGDEDEVEPLEGNQVIRLRRMVDFLLALSGPLMIVGGERDFLESIDADLATDEDLTDVEDLLEQREREAHLRGEPWTWEERP